MILIVCLLACWLFVVAFERLLTRAVNKWEFVHVDFVLNALIGSRLLAYMVAPFLAFLASVMFIFSLFV